MKFVSLDDLLLDQLKDLYSAESQLIKALPRMAKGASSEALREAFTEHLEQTRGQLERLQQIADMLDVRLAGKKCVAMEGLIEEGKEVLEADGSPALLDAALIAAAQRVEHYEIAGYGTARTFAQQLGQEEVARLLQETLQEESGTDEKLTELSVDEILPAAMSGEEEEESAPRGRGKTRAGRR